MSGPGIPNTDVSGPPWTTALSCTGPGDCVLLGDGQSATGRANVFVAEETGGGWGQAQDITGMDNVASGFVASLTALHCFSQGNCVAAGYYEDASSVYHGVVITETGGTWGNPAVLPLDPFTLNVAMSCTAPGDCAFGGNGFLLLQVGGKWASVQPVSGSVNAVSCAATGHCAAVGANIHNVPFIVETKNGTWGAQRKEPSLTQLTQVACPAVGACVAVGVAASNLAYEVSETNGNWASPAALPGQTALGAPPSHWTFGYQNPVLACGGAGQCSVFAQYQASANSPVAVLVSVQKDGVWTPAEEIPGLAAVNTGIAGSQASAGIIDASCWSPANCTAGGMYTPKGKDWVPFVVDETNGTWGSVVTIRGTQLDLQVTDVSCTAPRACTVAGYGGVAFASSKIVLATATSASLSVARVPYGFEQDEKVTAVVSATGDTVATGAFVVYQGSRHVCGHALASGSGACRVPATEFGAGNVTLTAIYGGDGTFAGSIAPGVSFTVVKAATSTALSLSSARITYGKETSETLHVAVTPKYAGTPAGTVTVTAGSIRVCVIKLQPGHYVGCRFTATKLKSGTYRLTATYAGSADFTASVSAKHILTVVG